MKDFLLASVAVICADTPKSAAEEKKRYLLQSHKQLSYECTADTTMCLILSYEL